MFDGRIVLDTLSVGCMGVEVRAGGMGESELDTLVSMSSELDELVLSSSQSLSTSGQGEHRGSEEGEQEGKEEAEEEASSDSTEGARHGDDHSTTDQDPSLGGLSSKLGLLVSHALSPQFVGVP